MVETLNDELVKCDTESVLGVKWVGLLMLCCLTLSIVKFEFSDNLTVGIVESLNDELLKFDTESALEMNLLGLLMLFFLTFSNLFFSGNLKVGIVEALNGVKCDTDSGLGANLLGLLMLWCLTFSIVNFDEGLLLNPISKFLGFASIRTLLGLLFFLTFEERFEFGLLGPTVSWNTDG
jgi:hypothetical protein